MSGWAGQGMWNALLQTLVYLGLIDEWQHMISTTVSCPFTGYGRKKEAHSEALSRLRGGFTGKIYSRCDNQRYPLGFILTGGQV